MRERKRGQRGQSTIEFALVYSAILLPVTFGIIFLSQLLWIWHSVNDFTRRGASYATTHCWVATAANVTDFMRSNVPPMINQDQFTGGTVEIRVSYFGRDPDTGQLVPFTCESECSTSCIPETVNVSISGYEFRTFVTAIGLPPVQIPNFQTSLPMESAGCDPEQGICVQ